ncbi:MAG: SulP family inorganic anion transporter, partial [Myxococcota bacterium]
GDLDQAGVRIVGSVPEGLPHITLPTVELSAMATLWPIALTIALVGFMESIAVAKKYAQMNRYEVQADQELLGLGLANLAGAITQGYPVTGGFSRTAVNAQAGAKSGVAALITALVIGLTLLFFTPLFYYLPKAILASIIMTAVFGLVDLHEVKHLWVVKRSDLAMLAVTFVATLTLGIERGILLGVVASLLLIVYHSTRPHVAVLGRLPGSDVYRNINRFPEAEQLPGVLALRLDSQFYFGNVNFLKDTLESLESERAGGVDVVVLDASGINQIDASAETALREITEAYRRRCVRFILTDLKGPVRDVLERSSYYDVIGRENVFQRVEDAMAALAKNSIGPSLAPSLRDSKTNEEVSC